MIHSSPPYGSGNTITIKHSFCKFSTTWPLSSKKEKITKKKKKTMLNPCWPLQYFGVYPLISADVL